MYTVRKSAKVRKISTDIEMEVLPPGLSDGDKFTVPGFRLLSDGTSISNCKPGTETVFTIKRVTTGDIKTCIS